MASKRGLKLALSLILCALFVTYYGFNLMNKDLYNLLVDCIESESFIFGEADEYWNCRMLLSLSSDQLANASKASQTRITPDMLYFFFSRSDKPSYVLKTFKRLIDSGFDAQELDGLQCSVLGRAILNLDTRFIEFYLENVDDPITGTPGRHDYCGMPVNEMISVVKDSYPPEPYHTTR